jgi:hypothetical protein
MLSESASPWRGPARLAAHLALAAAVALLPGCKRPYRIGERVLVEWEEGTSQYYPAFIVERVGSSRYRVHFEGYDTRFEEDIGADRIAGRVDGPVVAPPPPKKVARGASSASADAGTAVLVNPYKTGDRLRVRWRGSVYPATVLDVVTKDRVLVRYDGFESAWDESVQLDRVVSRR